MVAVCLAPTDLRPEVDELTGEVTSDLRRADLPAGEAAALEHALRVAEAWDGWVLAVAVGAAEIDPVLREVSALGVETVRVDWEPEWAPPGRTGPAPTRCPRPRERPTSGCWR
jgi:electron transfer flavoprotein beta subunit